MADAPIAFCAILTTGPSPAQDQVVEAAAIRLDGARAEEFSQLAQPAVLPPGFEALTGLKARDLLRKPAPRAALRKLLRFVTARTVVVHDAPLFRAFLEAQGLKPPACLDVKDLARIVRPEARDYTGAGIAQAIGLQAPASRRALEQARLTSESWRRLLEGLRAIPPAALEALCRVVQAAGDPLARVLAAAAASTGGFELSADAESRLRGLFKDYRKLLEQVQKLAQREPTEQPVPTAGICRMFAEAGLIAQRMPNYEHRPEQVDMAQAVCDALNGPHHLTVEAGTGTGKSLAYLLPAVAWACTNHDNVVISTNTKNLQEQLYGKDLPFLSSLMPGRFRTALLKGRGNYLCVRRFLHLLEHFGRELAEPGEVAALAPLIVWAAQTESGDLGECNGFLLSQAAPSVARWIVTGPDECAGRACRLRTRCFVQRARAAAQLADVIVVNHALLFSELGLDQPVLPPYRCVVFDEAHNLEDVATYALAIDVDGLSVFRVTNLLYRPRADGSGTGLLAAVMHELGKRLLPSAEMTHRRTMELAGRAIRAVQEVAEAARQFFELAAEPFQEVPPYVERLLLRDCRPDLGKGSAAWDAGEALGETVRILCESTERLAAELETAPQMGETGQELAADLRAQAARLAEVGQQVRFVLAQEDEAHVYWLERTMREGRAFCALRAAPLHVGQYMRGFFFNEKRCVVLTSATLQVDGSFDYVLERLGADTLPPGRLRCVTLGSSFDYERQALVGVTSFLPDPGGRRQEAFDVELSSFLIDLLQCTRGRALVLFTSYSLLDAVYEAIREPLARAGIPVLAQGHSGSREAVTSYFREVTSSVLLGTRSFWEGVDVSGESLSCLVLTKLPFHVVTDPLVQGRIECLRGQGRDPFTEYTLPEAVVSFRQGVGRLIRTRTDRGIIIVTDRRLVTKSYGKTFLESLPARHSVFRTRQSVLEGVRRFFESTPS
jgi:predicted DnaQ family exonuclease/DinG family helicase